MSHIFAAKKLMDDFPEYTKGLSVIEVERIWEEYSETLAAGWMIPDSESVRIVFETFNGEKNE